MDADLIARLGERCSGPIRFGVDDCVHLAADVVAERTGVDPLAGERPGPISPERAQEIIAGNGGLVRWMLRRGWSRAEPDVADIGLAWLGDRWAAAFPVGGGWWAARADAGVAVMPVTHIRRAWRCRS